MPCLFLIELFHVISKCFQTQYIQQLLSFFHTLLYIPLQKTRRSKQSFGYLTGYIPCSGNVLYKTKSASSLVGAFGLVDSSYPYIHFCFSTNRFYFSLAILLCTVLTIIMCVHTLFQTGNQHWIIWDVKTNINTVKQMELQIVVQQIKMRNINYGEMTRNRIFIFSRDCP